MQPFLLFYFAAVNCLSFMNTLRPESIVAFLDAPNTIKSILDSSIWAAQRLHSPIALLYSRPDLQVVNRLKGHANIPEHSIKTKTASQLTVEQPTNCQLVECLKGLAYDNQGEQLLQSAGIYCNEHFCKEPVYFINRHCSMSESLDYVDTSASLIITGHMLTCELNLANFIRPSHRPILVVADSFVTPSSALLAFDNKPTCHRLVDWLIQSSLLRGMTLHVVMVAEDTPSNQDALRETYAKLTQAGYKCKKHLIYSRHVASALLSYQHDHKLDMLISGAFGQSRLREWLQGSNTEQLLQGSETPYLLFPKSR